MKKPYIWQLLILSTVFLYFHGSVILAQGAEQEGKLAVEGRVGSDYKLDSEISSSVSKNVSIRQIKVEFDQNNQDIFPQTGSADNMRSLLLGTLLVAGCFICFVKQRLISVKNNT